MYAIESVLDGRKHKVGKKVGQRNNSSLKRLSM